MNDQNSNDVMDDSFCIAVIGVAGRFPGATDISQLWSNLTNGVESISHFTKAELIAAGVSEEDVSADNYVRAGGFLDDMDLFDAKFFGYTPREAGVIDPQQRIFLETAWQSLEHAGYNPESYKGKVGVYAGVSSSSYLFENIIGNSRLIESLGTQALLQGSDKDYLCSRVSHKLNLRGPAVTVQTACSSSLVAVHLACQSILSGECDMALAGGVSIGSLHKQGYFHTNGGILSPDGHCRAFDAAGAGTVAGSGAGIVVLKSLAAARSDGDTIYAVIRGSAINNDGSDKVGFSAPSVNGQASVVLEALTAAGITADSISYVEAHGTGTLLGDPIELKALQQAFNLSTERKRYCAIGSIKTNIGHLDAAAGIAGLIKTVLALCHRKIPASLHFTRENPNADLSNSPFYVSATTADWHSNQLPRRAGVSSFGMGGTNAHVILEEAPPADPSEVSRGSQVILLSAKSPAALSAASSHLENFLRLHPAVEIADVAHTTQVGRKHLSCRRSLVCDDVADALQKMEKGEFSEKIFPSDKREHQSLAFLFPGQGTQHVNMARQLYETKGRFRSELDKCSTILEPLVGLDIRSILYPSGDVFASEELINHTQFTQPILFAIEYALAKQLMEWGVMPTAFLGHSVGEYVAACLAGVFSLDDALLLIAERGRLIASLPSGAMLAVHASAQDINAILSEDLWIAAINAPSACSVSGSVDAIQSLSDDLKRREIAFQPLLTSHAFHSGMLNPILQEYGRCLSRVQLKTPSTPFISNVTGNWITAQEAVSPDYWIAHLRKTVRFSDCVNTLLSKQPQILVEVGPGQVLASLVKQHMSGHAGVSVFSTLPRSASTSAARSSLLRALGELWVHGENIQWEKVHADEKRVRIALPTYPFEKQRYWVDQNTKQPLNKNLSSKKKPPRTEWLYAPSWKRSTTIVGPKSGSSVGTHLILSDKKNLCSRYVEELSKTGGKIILVMQGTSFGVDTSGAYTIDPTKGEHYERLVSDLARRSQSPHSVTTFLSVGAPQQLEERIQYGDFCGLLFLVQAFGKIHIERTIAINVVTNGVYSVDGSELLAPEKATILGPCLVAPLECANIRCRHIDIALKENSPLEEKLCQLLVNEVTSEIRETSISYRGIYRWVQTFERLPVAAVNRTGARDNIHCLITGGLGGVGFAFAEYLAEKCKHSRITLFGRSVIPDRGSWGEYLAAHDDANSICTKIRKIQLLEKKGAKVLYISGSVSDRSDVQALAKSAESSFGPVHGVFHAAGLPGDSVILRKTESRAREIMESKLDGTLLLDEVFGFHKLDFVMLCSSVNSLFPQLGQVDYCSANAFLDAYSHQAQISKNSNVISVNWARWRNLGMAAGSQLPNSSRSAESINFSIDESDAPEIFDYLLSLRLPQVVVSPLSLEEFIGDISRASDGPHNSDAATTNDSFEHTTRPKLKSAYAPPRDNVEKTLVDIWQALLGIDPVGIDDDFFELGGHSLLAVQLVARIRHVLRREIALRELFEMPTIKSLVEKFGETAEVALVPIEVIDRRDTLPLSLAQQRLWFIDQLQGVGTAYHMPNAVKLVGKLDHHSLQAALNTLMRRHEALRTTFANVEGKAVQIIAPDATFALQMIDLSTHAGELRSTALAHQVSEAATAPFDLSKGPLVRGHLIRFEANEHVLVITMHHIISDGWSIGIFIRELAELYAAYRDGGENPLRDLPIQYADYSQWQHRWLQGAVLDGQLNYWKDHLRGAPVLLELPTDHPRPAVQSFRGGRVDIDLGTELSAQVRALSRSQDVTLHMLLFSAFAVLLSRLSHSKDLVIGTPVANRQLTEVEGLIGFFVNTLALRVRLEDANGEINTEELLKRVKDLTLTGYDNQAVPFEHVVEALQPSRSLSHNPVIQAMFALQNAHQPELKLPELVCTPYEVAHATEQFDLSLSLHEVGGKIVGSLSYASDLFDRSTMNRWIGCLINILRGMVLSPDVKIGSLPFLDQSEYHRIVRGFNATDAEYPRDRLIHEIFEDQVAKAPGAIAIVVEDQALTYAELNSRANQIAHRLRELGASVGEYIPVLLPRSLETLVAQLGVLKCGCAYVPIDPEIPVERQVFVIDDCEAKIVITNSNLILSGRRHTIQWCALDFESEIIQTQPRSNLQRMREATSPAYVMYTSGSTGKPKGVIVPHHAVNRLVINNKYVAVDPTDCIVFCSNPAFDASTFEVWASFLNGARLFVIQKETLLDPILFAAALEKQNVSILHLTTALFNQYARALAEVFTRLKCLLFGGEAADLNSVRRVLERSSPQSLIHLYGPTETTSFASFYRITSVPDEARSIPIGQPISNAQIYILDNLLQPVPIGVSGEIYVGGAGVADGYLNRPELTAERFIHDPFSKSTGARFYRTGDIARWREDGNIEYLGRNDQQVKIRGFRIEPGEVEAQLTRYPQVQDAVVIAREDNPGEKRLVAYIASSRERLKLTAVDDSHASATSLVSGWQDLYDNTYRSSNGEDKPGFIGWNSSYTGQPIPENEMRDWVNFTVSRLRALSAKRILEIGCGVGLIAEQLAPHCDEYHGTDFSGAAIAQLRHWANTQKSLQHLQLSRRAATDFTGIDSASLDVVILNSVVQYFPDAEYLLNVLEQAIEKVVGNGKIFIGDVRNLDLLQIFHSSIQLTKAGSELTAQNIRARSLRAAENDKELVISPQFFRLLPDYLASIQKVEIHLKRGRADNELTRYRYDVVLHIGNGNAVSVQAQDFEYGPEFSADKVSKFLHECRPAALRIKNIPNRRLARDLEDCRLLNRADDLVPASELQCSSLGITSAGEDPEDYWELAESHSYEVIVSWSPQSDHGFFDVELTDPTQSVADLIDTGTFAPLGPRNESWFQGYVNDPLASNLRRQLGPKLRKVLSKHLPDYMVPAAFVVVEAMPLTPNGKLDKGALPLPDTAMIGREYEAPQGKIEEALAIIWQELLNIECVGRHDNFFELGGHSLLIVQMIERLKHVGIAANVRSVFSSPSIAAMAGALEETSASENTVPQNEIPIGAEKITPQMLTLVDLSADDIERIVTDVPGGVVNIQDIYPLSYLQEGILFHHLLNEQGDAYVMSMLLAVESKERLDACLAALQLCISRHEVFRSAVMWKSLPQPVQVVLRDVVLPIEQLNLDVGQDAISQLKVLMKSGSCGIDLYRPPLMRARIADDKQSSQWYLLLDIHHLIADHASAELLLSEITAIFEGRSDQIPQPIAYREYVARALLQKKHNKADEYFHSKLHDVDEPTLPFGLANLHGDGSQVGEARHLLTAHMSEGVRSIARRLGVSAAALFHVVWALVVGRCSGRDDVVFGTVLLGRLHGMSGAGRAMGMLINTLPLRLKLTHVTVLELVKNTHNELAELLRYEQASLANAQRCSGLEKGEPLFSAILNYRHSTSIEDVDGYSPSIAGIRMIAGKEQTNYPFVMSVDDTGQQFLLTAQTDHPVDPHRVVAYVETTLESLLKALDSEAEKPAIKLDVIPEAERRQSIISFNDYRTQYSQDKLVHELFESQAGKTPDAISVKIEDVELSYSQLNSRANQLARRLLECGIGPDQLVGICMERSIEMVISILGVLKAGGAYVPLDPGYPSERLHYMLKDAAPRVILTQDRLRCLLSQSEAFVISVDDQWQEIARYDTSNVATSSIRISSRNLAYVIYTSGSTGTPKGVMNEHRGLVNRLEWMQDEYRLDQHDRVLQKTPFSFDVSVWEFLWPLLTGARMVLARPGGHQDPEYLAQLIQQAGITTLHFVPSMLQAFLDGAKIEGCTSLRHIICSGEELPVVLQNKCLQRLPQAQLHNLYGPTEAAIDVTYWKCHPQSTAARVPIGRPIANIQIYILDTHGQPAPIGISGEIYIGGIGVGRGYWKRPDLTAEKFIKDPFSSDPLARVYRTGDLGRWLPDGTVQYLGRNDHQVKIRGLRIELGEIETQLSRLEQVNEAVVVAQDDGSGGKRLVAYLTSHEEASITAEILRSQLELVLPDYMLPAAFVMLDTLPLTPNGKLDRKALPAPELSAYSTKVYEPPQGEFEKTLAIVWQDLLKVERVGRGDNFFALGGHSLTIIKMIERLRQMGIHATVRNVFSAPTLMELATRLHRNTVSQIDVLPNNIPADCLSIKPEMVTLIKLQPAEIETISKVVPGRGVNIQDIYPLTPLQEGILFHHLISKNSDPYILPMLLEVQSKEILDSLLGALQAVVNRHDVLRTAVAWEGLHRPVQIVHREAVLPVEEIALDPNQDALEQLKNRITPEKMRMQLWEAPLMRVQIARDHGKNQWYMILLLHHLIDDATSLRILVSELKAILAGRITQLPAAVPYRSFVAQTILYETKNSAEEFFREKLADVEQPTTPFGLIDVYGDGSQIKEASRDIEDNLSSRIRGCARRLGISTAAVFHAAWALVVAKTSGQSDVTFGSVLSGRLQGMIGADRALGMFINTLPLRLQLQGVDVRQLLLQTQHELAELLRHEQASLALAQRCSSVGSGAPLFSAVLNYRHSSNTPGSTGEERGSIEGIRVLHGHERTNYPLSVSVDDTGNGFTLTAKVDRLIDPSTVASYLHTALGAVVSAVESAPGTLALHLPVLSESERQKLLVEWSGEAKNYSDAECVHHLFEMRAKEKPEAIVLVYEDKRLTYADLNRRANQVAHYLRTLGVGPDRLVALCMERSIEMVVGLLGILKAGGVYLPLDPGYPSERIAYIVDEANPCALLTHSSLATKMGSCKPPIVALDACWSEIENYSETNLDKQSLELESAHLAYVIYTSGSTGQPKAVAISHHAICDRLQWFGEKLGVEASDRILLKTPITFDVSVREFLLPLRAGAALVVAKPDGHKDPEYLADVISHHAITIIHFVPSMLSAFVSNNALSKCGSLRHVLCGGEALSRTLCEMFFKKATCRLHNLYGPTEATIFATHYECRPDTNETAIPIGRPVGNTQIYILDAQMQLVPTGVAGEIYIGGTGVARSYLNRADLTKERFFQDPFSHLKSARIYKTGDLAKWRTDGNIEYLGRNDHQVKIRGFRIELGEIEAQLATHPTVRDVTVLAREDVPGDKRLVAYITSAANNPNIDELRSHLKAKLPEYMIPSAFVVLDALPLTSNGKIDRKALPVPEMGQDTIRQYEAPQGEVELMVAEVWQEILHRERVGRRDNFFELGGHSLLIVQMIERFRQLGLRAEAKTIFTSQTLEELAKDLSTNVLEEFVVPPNLIPSDSSQKHQELVELKI